MKNEITNTSKPVVLQSDGQTPVDSVSTAASADNTALMRRRNLLKTGIVAVPAVMTLHSGAAKAQASVNGDCKDFSQDGSCWASLHPDD